MRRGAGVEDAGDGRVVHQRQRCRSASKRASTELGVHAGLDDLERDLPPRLQLFGEPDFAHAAVADLPDQAVGADLHPRRIRQLLGVARHLVTPR